MEGKPASELTLSAVQLSTITTDTVKSGGGNMQPSGEQEQEVIKANDDDDEITVSEDDDDGDGDGYDDGDSPTGKNGGREECNLGSDGVAASPRCPVVEGVASNRQEASVDDSSDDERDVKEISGKDHQTNATSDISESSSTESEASEGDVGGTRRGANYPVDSPRSPDTSLEYNSSPDVSRENAQEGNESDSSFDGSGGEYDSSSNEEQNEYDSDGFVREVPYPPCSLHHQHRKTYKESLCQECYAKYKSDLQAAGLYDGSDEEPRLARTKRRKKNGIVKRRDARASRGRRSEGEIVRSYNSDGLEPNAYRMRKRKGSTKLVSGQWRKEVGEDVGRHHAIRARTSRLVSNCGKADRLKRVIKENRKAGLSDTSSDEGEHSVQTIANTRKTVTGGVRVLNRAAGSRGISASTAVGIPSACAAESLALPTPEPTSEREKDVSSLTGNGRVQTRVTKDVEATRGETKGMQTGHEVNGEDIQGEPLCGQSRQNRAAHLSKEETSNVPTRYAPNRGLEQSAITPPAEATVGKSWHPQLDQGGKDAASSPVDGVKMRNTEVKGDARLDGKGESTGRCLPQKMPMDLSDMGSEMGDVTNADRRKKSPPSSHDDSRAGKRARGDYGRNSVPTSKAGYVRDARYTGVVQKVTNGKYFVWVDEKLHDGTPYDSAEECAREHDKLQDNRSRRTPWGSRRNFGDVKAPSHVETMGLTPLTSAPGSRMAKPITSGYLGYRQPTPTPQSKRPPPRHSLSGDIASGKQRGHQSEPAVGKQRGHLSESAIGKQRGHQSESTVGKQRGHQSESGTEKRRGHQVGSASERDFSDVSSPSVPSNIDLPIQRRRAGLGTTPSLMPLDFDKIRWSSPIHTVGRPLDGSFIPTPRDALPRRSSFKGGRQANAGRAGAAGGQAYTSLTHLKAANEGYVQIQGVNDLITDEDVVVVDGKVSPILVESSSAQDTIPPPGAGGGKSPAQSSAESTLGRSLVLPTVSPRVDDEEAPTREAPPITSENVVARTSGVCGHKASDVTHSTEKRDATSTVEVEASKSIVRANKESSDRNPLSTPQEDRSSVVDRPLNGDRVPLRDHLAQMRHHGPAQSHIPSPWCQAEENQLASRSGAEERGQEALLRWMHQETANDDKRGGKYVTEDSHVTQSIATSSPSTSSLAAPADEHLHHADAGFAADDNTLNAASEKAMDEEDEDEVEDEDMEDLAEYENLVEQLAELGRDVGALSSIMPVTASTAAKGIGNTLFVSAATPSCVDTAQPCASVVAGTGVGTTYVPQSVRSEEGYEHWPTVSTTEDGVEKEALPPSPVPPFVPSQPVPSETTDTVGVTMVAQDPTAPLSPVVCPVAENITTGVTAEDRDSCLPLVPAVTCSAPLRLSRSGKARTIEDAKGAGYAQCDEPPPVPQVSWRPPARLPQGNNTESNSSLSSAETVQPEHPRRIAWVTPRALQSSKPAVAALDVIRPPDSAQCLDVTTASPAPNVDHSREAQRGNTLCSAQQKGKLDVNSNHDALDKALISIKIRMEQKAQLSCSHAEIEPGNVSTSSESRTVRSRSRSNDTGRSRSNDTSRSNETRRSGSSRGSHRSHRDYYRDSSRERHRYRRRSPHRSTGRRSPDDEDDYYGGSRNSRSLGRDSGRGSYWRGHDSHGRERERREGSRDAYNSGRYDQSNDGRYSYDREARRGYREDRKFSSRESRSRKTQHVEGDWAGRTPKQPRSSSRDRSSR